MTNAIIIIILIVLIGMALRHIYRSIKYGRTCCGSGGAKDKKIKVQDKNKNNYPYSYKVKVEGMMCTGCARKVENAFNSDGMLWAKVDLENNEVTLLSKRNLTEDEVVEKLGGTSYTVREVI